MQQALSMPQHQNDAAGASRRSDSPTKLTTARSAPGDDGAAARHLPSVRVAAAASPMAAAAASPYPKDVEVGFAPFAGGGATNGGGGGGLPLLKAPSIKSQYAAASTPRRARTAGDHDDPEAPFPLPRFPVAHTSAAFEAVAARKSLILTPPEIYAECAHHGEEKGQHEWLKMLVLTIIAGCYVGFGFSLCLLVGGNLGLDIYKERPGLFSLLFGAVGFPTGFTFIVVCGGELFTSLCAYMAAAWWERRVSGWTCLRVWAVSWVGNFVGAALFVGLMVAAGSFERKEAFALILAGKKTHHSFGQCFVLGIFCNWLVCLATWMSCAAQDMAGKFVAIWLPISAFVMMGFEHIIANQFLLPLAIALGAPLSAYDVIVGNLIPTTLGNWFGGAVCVATAYAFAFGSPNQRARELLAAARSHARGALKRR